MKDSHISIFTLAALLYKTRTIIFNFCINKIRKIFTWNSQYTRSSVYIVFERVYQMNWLFGLFSTRFNQYDVFGSQSKWALSQQENFYEKSVGKQRNSYLAVEIAHDFRTFRERERVRHAEDFFFNTKTSNKYECWYSNNDVAVMMILMTTQNSIHRLTEIKLWIRRNSLRSFQK